MDMATLYIFLATGTVCMSLALSVGALNKLPEEEKPAFMLNKNKLVAVVMLGNLAAITLLFSVAYGIRNIDWWIPVSCLFITFPAAHLIIFERLWGNKANIFIMSPLLLISMGALAYFW